MTGEAAALGSAAFWALSTVVLKSVSGRLSAFYIMATRSAIAAILAVVLVALVSPGDFRLDLPAATTAVLLGSALVAILGDVAFIRAIAVEEVGRVFTVSTSLYIIVSVAGSVIFAGEPFSWFLLLGGVAVLTGARLVLVESLPENETPSARTRQPMFALWLSIIAAILWSGSLLTVSDAMESVEPLTATVMRMPFMALSLGLFVAVRGDVRTHGWYASDVRTLAVSGALTLGSMLLFLLAAKSASPGIVAVLTSTSPIFAVPMAFLFLKERVTMRVATGTTVCMTGVWLTFL